jgi:flagellar assembly factor FliW
MSAALTFTAPPPGLSPLTDFKLTAIEGAAGLYSLTTQDAAGIRLFLLDAAVYLPDYRPVVTETQLQEVGLSEPADCDVLVVAKPGETKTTVNLMAPIILNRATGSCTQVILDGQGWELDAELSLA